MSRKLQPRDGGLNFSLIVAMTRSGVIGRSGQLPWRLSADLKRFKALTMGHHLIMGRKTWDSLGRALPGRKSIVVSRQPALEVAAGVLAAPSLSKAIGLVTGDTEPFIIGGGEIYRLALPEAARLYVTWVEAEVAGDTYFPSWSPDDWQLAAESRHSADEKNQYDYTFCTYDRIR